MTQLLDLLAGHDRCGALLHGLIPLSKGQLQGGAPAFPLGLVVLLILLAFSQRYVGGHAEDCECAHGDLRAATSLAGVA